jgi:hypothetical protein
MPVKVYAEHGALNQAIRRMQDAGRIELLHFPYDPDSRSKAIPGTAAPSAARIDDLHLPIGALPGKISDYEGSPHYPTILGILGAQNRRDALHVDSAFKSGCRALLTRDSDILTHRDRLEAVLGIRFFHPDRDEADFSRFVADQESRTPGASGATGESV